MPLGNDTILPHLADTPDNTRRLEAIGELKLRILDDRLLYDRILDDRILDDRILDDRILAIDDSMLAIDDRILDDRIRSGWPPILDESVSLSSSVFIYLLIMIYTRCNLFYFLFWGRDA
jgi:hypothetical protein